MGDMRIYVTVHEYVARWSFLHIYLKFSVQRCFDDLFDAGKVTYNYKGVASAQCEISKANKTCNIRHAAIQG